MELKIALAMDDKILTIEVTWAQVANSSERQISEFILKEMKKGREDRPTQNGA